MRIDRSHVPWFLFVALATCGAALLFLANFHPHRLPFPIHLPRFFGEAPPVRNTFGGTPLGLIFGSLAFLIFLFASALGIRKKKRLWRIGNVQLWLKAHIWLTILTIPLVLFHCGFHAGGPHTTGLVILYLFVMGSGFFGLALQQFMPRQMKDRLPREVVFEQIPHIRQRLVAAAEEMQKLVAQSLNPPKKDPAVEAKAATEGASAVAVELDPSVGILNQFLIVECLPYLCLPRGEKHRLGDERISDDVFRLLKLNLTEKWQPKAYDLQAWCNDRRQLDLQMKLHHWLHGWLLIHVPTSFALLIYTAWHAWVAVRFLVIFP
ncbi:MAG: hypothetical protein QOE70_1187 [Chthoniobacter sp.]|jgi:hypothetical protein|nr:hypothetical protein [Chthoniobacter sp.]